MTHRLRGQGITAQVDRLGRGHDSQSSRLLIKLIIRSIIIRDLMISYDGVSIRVSNDHSIANLLIVLIYQA
jgi:hypothetical protein